MLFTFFRIQTRFSQEPVRKFCWHRFPPHFPNSCVGLSATAWKLEVWPGLQNFPSLNFRKNVHGIFVKHMILCFKQNLYVWAAPRTSKNCWCPSFDNIIFLLWLAQPKLTAMSPWGQEQLSEQQKHDVQHANETITEFSHLRDQSKAFQLAMSERHKKRHLAHQALKGHEHAMEINSYQHLSQNHTRHWAAPAWGLCAPRCQPG